MSRYVPFTLSEFKENIVYKPIWIDTTNSNSNEYIYTMTLNNGIQIIIYSSIHTKYDETRAVGLDAVRIIVKSNSRVINKATCYRTVNCFDNIKKKITAFYKQYSNCKVCSTCNNGHLVQREGKYGIFYGCTNYKNH